MRAGGWDQAWVAGRHEPCPEDPCNWHWEIWEVRASVGQASASGAPGSCGGTHGPWMAGQVVSQSQEP